MTAKQSIIEAAHENCQRVYELHRPHITIDDEAAQALACSLSGEAEAVRKALRGLALPVRYDDLQQEVSHTLLQLLRPFGTHLGHTRLPVQH